MQKAKAEQGIEGGALSGTHTATRHNVSARIAHKP
jgi:hypothetical protein